MNTYAPSSPTVEKLQLLSRYASYLFQHRFTELIDQYQQRFRELDLPLSRIYARLEETDLGREMQRFWKEFLQGMQVDEPAELIRRSIERWRSDQHPILRKAEIEPADLLGLSHLRKDILLHFINGFTGDAGEVVQLVREINAYFNSWETQAMDLYTQLLREQVRADHLLIERVNHTIPGAIYIFDHQLFRNIYSNGKLAEIIGYSSDELNAMGENAISQLIHPDDVLRVKDHLQVIRSLKDGEVATIRYRVRDRHGDYRWLANHVAGFRRSADGEIQQTIGITLSVDEEQKQAEASRRSEKLYRQAEELAHIGNFYWMPDTGKLEWSEELYRIVEVDADVAPSLALAESICHPEDLKTVRNQADRLVREGHQVDFTHRIQVNGKTKIVRLRARLQAEDSERSIVGTVQDVTEKQNLIHKLQEKDILHQQAEELANMGGWIWDLQTGGVEWTTQMYKIYGLDPGQPLKEDPFPAFIHPDDRERMQEVKEKILKDGQSDHSFRIVLPHGKVRNIHTIARLFTDAEGKPSHIIGAEQDVTEKQHILHQLQESETLYKQAQSLANLGNWSMDVRTREIHWSDQMYRIFELERSRPLTLDEWLTFLDREEGEAALAYYEECLRERKTYDRIHQIRLRNGKVKTIHRKGEFVYDARGEAVRMIGTTQDITAEYNVQQELKENQKFIQQIADASPTILYLFDAEEQSIRYINREIFFVLGYLPDEVIGAGEGVTKLLYHPDDYHLLPGRRESGKGFNENDTMMQYECRMRYKDGTWRWVLVREIVFSTGKDGSIKQILGTALDINRRKEMERTILQNTVLLEQSNASLEEFAYVASHDLKEPLRKISTFGDRLVITQQERLNPEGKLYLQKIVDASQRMQTMISDLLSISLIRGNTAFEIFSLQSVLDEVQQTLEFRLEQLSAEVIADKLPEAKVIPSQFRQLFQNLMSNSLKFVKPGVRPRLEVRYELVSPAAASHFGMLHPGPSHKIEFIDNGIGFENEFAGKIFAIFQRLHGRSEYEGSGIGLAICKKIIEHHGGVIFAHGILGEGATFTILIPA